MKQSKLENTTCPYLGEFNPSSEASPWECRFSSRDSDQCKLVDPSSWGRDCSYFSTAVAVLSSAKLSQVETAKKVVDIKESIIDSLQPHTTNEEIDYYYMTVDSYNRLVSILNKLGVN